MKIPKYGDLMTMEEFIEACDCRCFIDYDGFGKYSDGIEMSDFHIYPSDVTSVDRKGCCSGPSGELLTEKYSHVVWFNR